MEIHIKTIPHDHQRYETCGDYYYDQDSILQVRISDMGNDFYATMVAVHEIIEEAITKKNGITEQQIMDFDLAFEAARKIGLKTETEEPGFSNDSPYRAAHAFATGVELGMCALTDTSWADYDNCVINL